MEKTKNYEIFKRHDANRPIDEANLRKVIKSIRMKNLLPYRPLLVDSQMRVIDGQHRLAAAKELGLEIYYEIQKDASHEDMWLLNDNAKQWGKEDYLNFYCAQGKEEYLKLRNFMNTHKASLSTALIVFGQGKGSNEQHQTYANLFKQGKYLFPAVGQTIEAIEIFKHSEEVIKFLSTKMQGNKNFLIGAIFRRALYLFLSIRSVDFDVFMQKLNQRLDLVRACVTIKLYVSVFKGIYNYKNRTPLFIESEKPQDREEFE